MASTDASTTRSEVLWDTSLSARFKLSDKAFEGFREFSKDAEMYLNAVDSKVYPFHIPIRWRPLHKKEMLVTAKEVSYTAWCALQEHVKGSGHVAAVLCYNDYVKYGCQLIPGAEPLPATASDKVQQVLIRFDMSSTFGRMAKAYMSWTADHLKPTGNTIKKGEPPYAPLGGGPLSNVQGEGKTVEPAVTKTGVSHSKLLRRFHRTTKSAPETLSEHLRKDHGTVTSTGEAMGLQDPSGGTGPETFGRLHIDRTQHAAPRGASTTDPYAPRRVSFEGGNAIQPLSLLDSTGPITWNPRLDYEVCPGCNTDLTQLKLRNPYQGQLHKNRCLDHSIHRRELRERCPLCSVVFEDRTKEEKEAHVNQCLDWFEEVRKSKSLTDKNTPKGPFTLSRLRQVLTKGDPQPESSKSPGTATEGVPPPPKPPGTVTTKESAKAPKPFKQKYYTWFNPATWDKQPHPDDRPCLDREGNYISPKQARRMRAFQESQRGEPGKSHSMAQLNQKPHRFAGLHWPGEHSQPPPDTAYVGHQKSPAPLEPPISEHPANRATQPSTGYEPDRLAGEGWRRSASLSLSPLLNSDKDLPPSNTNLPGVNADTQLRIGTILPPNRGRPRPLIDGARTKYISDNFGLRWLEPPSGSKAPPNSTTSLADTSTLSRPKAIKFNPFETAKPEEEESGPTESPPPPESSSGRSSSHRDPPPPIPPRNPSRPTSGAFDAPNLSGTSQPLEPMQSTTTGQGPSASADNQGFASDENPGNERT